MLTSLEIKILAGLALVVALLIGVWAYNAHEQALGAAQFKADAAEKALAATQAAQAESTRREGVQQENLHESDRFNTQRAVDARDLDAVAERVRIAAASGRLAPGNSAAAAPSQAGSVPAAAVVSAELFIRAVEMARDAAKSADCLRGIGELCAGDYGALTNSAASSAPL